MSGKFTRRGVRAPPTRSEREVADVVRDVLEQGCRRVQAEFREPDDDWSPIYLVVTPEGMGAVFTGVGDKYVTTDVVAAFARRVGAVAIGHLASTWQVNGELDTAEHRAHADALQRRVQQQGGSTEGIPGRFEAVMIAVYTATSFVVQYARIERHAMTTATRWLALEGVMDSREARVGGGDRRDGGPAARGAGAARMSIEVTLADLARQANAEHGRVSDALRSALGHALAAGAVLAQAREQVDAWPEWCEANLRFDRHTANWYIRMHRYREALNEGEVNTVSGAMRFLRQHELSQRVNTEQKQRIYTMLDEGLPQYEVGERLGLSQSTVNRYAVARKYSRPPRPRSKPRWITHCRTGSGGRWDKAYAYFRQALGEVDDLAPNGEPRYDELYEHLYWIEDSSGVGCAAGTRATGAAHGEPVP